MNYLLADIGGTNTRCAIARDSGAPEKILTFENVDFADPAALLRRYLDSLAPEDHPERGALAVAGPVRDDAVHLLNIDWHIAVPALGDTLGLDHVTLLNDFEALAMALPGLDDDELRQVGNGTRRDDRTKAVIGPGTGLGVAGLVPVESGWRAIGGEGGHVTLPAADDEEANIVAKIRAEFGHCSAERLISGPGLTLLHAAIHDDRSVGRELDAAEIGTRATNGDPDANRTLEIFFRILGTVAANLALTLGAFGGVYIGGGMIPRYADKFVASGFRKRFEAKGRYGDYLENIPTYLIVAQQPTLKGLAAHARNLQGLSITR